MSRGVVIWFTGLPAAGKTTLARAVARRLDTLGRGAIVLDSDELRPLLAPGKGYGPRARAHFYRALGELAALLARRGHLVLVAATAHRRAFRAHARASAPRFFEVFVDVPVETCAARDFKGLYAKGKAARLPGVGVTYEPPLAPDLVVRGGLSRSEIGRVVGLLARAGTKAARSAPAARRRW